MRFKLLLIKLEFLFALWGIFLLVWQSDRFSLIIYGQEYPIYVISLLACFHILDIYQISHPILSFIRPFISTGFFLLGAKLTLSMFVIKDTILSKFGGLIMIKRIFTTKEKMDYLLYLFSMSKDQLDVNLRSHISWDQSKYSKIAVNSKSMEEVYNNFLAIFNSQMLEAKKIIIQESAQLNILDFANVLSKHWQFIEGALIVVSIIAIIGFIIDHKF